MFIFEDDVLDEEEHDERESRTFRIVKNCFKGLLYGASALVWILVFVVIFTTRESKLVEKTVFTEKTQAVASQNEDYTVKQLNVIDFMNKNGSIKLSDIKYAEETGELEINVRYNKKLTDGKTNDPITYVLTDQNGTEYEMVAFDQDAIGRYGYAKICFADVYIPLDPKIDDFTLTLTMTRKSDGKPLHTYVDEDDFVVNDSVFEIYTSKTTTSTVKFKK